MGYKRFWLELSELVGRPALSQTTCFHTLWNIISYGHERIPPSLTSLTENNNYFFSPQRTQSLKNGSAFFFFKHPVNWLSIFFAYSFCRLTGFSENLVQFASMTGSRNVFILTDALKEKTSDLLIWTLLQGCFTSSIHFERFLVFTRIIFCVRKVEGSIPIWNSKFFSVFSSSFIINFLAVENHNLLDGLGW